MRYHVHSSWVSRMISHVSINHRPPDSKWHSHELQNPRLHTRHNQFALQRPCQDFDKWKCSENRRWNRIGKKRGKRQAILANSSNQIASHLSSMRSKLGGCWIRRLSFLFPKWARFVYGKLRIWMSHHLYSSTYMLDHKEGIYADTNKGK